MNPYLRKILSLGVSSSIGNKENQITYTLNSIILMVQLVAIIYSVLSYIVAGDFTLSLVIFGFTFFMIIPLALNAYKHLKLARVAFILICYVNLLVSAVTFGSTTKFQIFIIAATVTPFILLRLSSKYLQWTLVGTGICFYLSYVIFFSFLPAQINLDGEILKNIGLLSDLSFIFILLGVIYIFVANNNHYERMIVKSNAQLKKANGAINDGLAYAKSIQLALLPSYKKFSNEYPNSFILQMPKDEVSGDFVWYDREGDFLYVLVGDCTGHGIPGSLISIMCCNIVDEVFKSQRNISPANFLNEIGVLLDKRIGKNIGSSIRLKDGMDCAMVKFNVKTGELQYSGARNELLIISDGNIMRQKGNRQSIEGNSKRDDYDFTNYKFKLDKGEIFYLYTDGYSDQKGGISNKKYYTIPFIDLLVNNRAIEASDQKQLLMNTFLEWKGKNDQFDDVTVLGFKYS